MSADPIAIVGGGLAGMAAAEWITRHSPGTPVVIFESKRRLGGRAGSFRDATGEVDYCQHVAMGCCSNFVDLMRQCSLLSHFRRLQELTFLHPDHPPSRFAANRWLPAPLHLLSTIDGLRFLSSSQRSEVKRGLLVLMRTPSESLQNTVADQWLRQFGQSDRTIAEFWDVILVSALGELSSRVSMAAARKVLIDGFAATRGASDVLVPTLPLADLFGRRLADQLRRRGVTIRQGCRVRHINPDRSLLVQSNEDDEQRIEPSAVICAVPWFGLRRLFQHWDAADRTPLPHLERIDSFPSSPITGVHLWFDRPITTMDQAVLVGTVSQWIFRNPISIGEAAVIGEAEGGGPSSGGDQVGDGHGAAIESDCQHYYQVIVSASAGALVEGKQSLLHTVLDELKQFFPAAESARLVRSRLVTDPESVFSIQPEVESERPGAMTGLNWLYLAGDWVQTGWPSTMEGAVISGRQAASACMRHTGLEHLEPIPLRPPPGLLARCLIRR
ncbi:hydroxysqualene dehydroxylase HpnE [Roseiconus lacunae]|uniref:Hydroxysqualene dehydroxylase HpnE n=1 Tax=Roseiconus lacunae TaxID=2605694 RepID=A0ABT7PIY5_9BACT|nr:hydroxysqualene dehydroxylase HpnE [Roseiconus lacunae]MDM4016226.1 hydroxysqualene dehydroxylase HpnE [Roseiconus lacunae]